MTSTPHLDHEQRRTLERLSGHPMPRNLKWPQVMALLKAMGEGFEESGDRYRVTFNGHTEVFHAPSHGDVPAETIVKLRHFLGSADTGPTKSG